MTTIVIAVGILSQVVARKARLPGVRLTHGDRIVAIVREGAEARFRARLGTREHDFSAARA